MAIERKFLSTIEEKNAVKEQFIQLRLSYMAEYPNLVAPNEEYVRAQTESLFAKDMTLVSAFDEDKLVGASLTGRHDAMFTENSPFEKFFLKTGQKSSDFGYTVFILIDAAYRGQGVGILIPAGSDELCQNLGLIGRLNETVTRPNNDPRAPEGYRDSTQFFYKIGYHKIPYLLFPAHYPYTGETEISVHYYQAWVKYYDR